MNNLTIIVPAFKELDNLKVLIPKIYKNLLNHFKNFNNNLIIVDGIVPDFSTSRICNEFGSTYINRVPDDTFGDAIRSGIDYVKQNFSETDWLIIMDADGSHNPDSFKDFRDQIDTNEPDIVIASRYVIGGGTKNNAVLILLSKLVNILYRILFDLPVKDVSNNYRLYKFDLLKDIDLVEKNFDIVEEILIKIIKKNKNVKITEIPSTFEKRKYGKSKRNLFIYAITYLYSIIRLKKFNK